MRHRTRAQTSRAGLSVIAGGRAASPAMPIRARRSHAVAAAHPADGARHGAERMRLVERRPSGAPSLSLRLGGALQRHHALLPLPFLVAALLSAEVPGPLHWGAGAALAAVGVMLQVAALAARPTDTGRLVRFGAYAWMRHPYYAGALFVWAGLTVLSGALTLLPVVVLAFAAAHLLIVRHEEAALEAAFGDEYARYQRRTPRWIPRKPIAALAEGADRSAGWRAARPMLAAYALVAAACLSKALAG